MLSTCPHAANDSFPVNSIMESVMSEGVALLRERRRFRPKRKKIKISNRRVKLKSKRRSKQTLVVKEEKGVSPLVKKYWVQRYDLFSRYNEDIQMDEEGWFSVTPEQIAVTHAVRCGGSVVIDGFAGVGGNAIQFATMCHHVIAIDIDPGKVALAYENAKVYGVEEHIDFIVGDFFQLAPSLKGDIVFVSPPWGGPTYMEKDTFTLDLLKPKDGYSLFQVAQSIAPNVIMYLPRNVDILQVEELCWLCSPPLKVEIEENMIHGKLKSITAYFGDIAFSD